MVSLDVKSDLKHKWVIMDVFKYIHTKVKQFDLDFKLWELLCIQLQLTLGCFVLGVEGVIFSIPENSLVLILKENKISSFFPSVPFLEMLLSEDNATSPSLYTSNIFSTCYKDHFFTDICVYNLLLLLSNIFIYCFNLSKPHSSPDLQVFVIF